MSGTGAAAAATGGAGAEQASSRSVLAKSAAQTTLDLSFMEITEKPEIVTKYREEVCGLLMGDDSEHPKATPFIVKLHNNGLEDVSCLDTVLSEICDLSKVTTLDLSFNKISTIEGAFDAFPSLKRLYLHGNKELNSFAEVLHLQVDCPSLTHLSLHGTGVREKPNYRNFIIATVPWIKSLDFSTVTRRDIEVAIHWRKMTKVAFKSPAASKKGAQ